MVWARFDHGYHEHPKILAVGPIGELVNTRAIGYCSLHSTDGFITDEALLRILRGLDQVFIQNDTGRHRASDIDWPARLVEGGLWERAARQKGKKGPRFKVHDFLKYNPSRASKEAARGQKSAAGRKGAEFRWGEKRGALSTALEVSGDRQKHLPLEPMAPANGPSVRPSVRTTKPPEIDQGEPLDPAKMKADVKALTEKLAQDLTVEGRKK